MKSRRCIPCYRSFLFYSSHLDGFRYGGKIARANELLDAAHDAWDATIEKVKEATKLFNATNETKDPPAANIAQLETHLQSALDAQNRAENRYTTAEHVVFQLMQADMNNQASSSRQPAADKTEEVTRPKEGKKPCLKNLDREIKTPPGGWFDAKGMGYKMNALSCADHNNTNLRVAWTAIDELVPLRENTVPLKEEDEADIVGDDDGTTHLSSTARLKAIAAITTMTLLIHNLHEKGKKLHMARTHGRSIATKFE